MLALDPPPPQQAAGKVRRHVVTGEDGVQGVVEAIARAAAGKHRTCVLIDEADFTASAGHLRVLVAGLGASVPGLCLWAAGVTAAGVPDCLQELTVTEPVRYAASVLHEVKETLAHQLDAILPYSSSGYHASRDGKPVTFIEHRHGEGGHLGVCPHKCGQCAREVASHLNSQVNGKDGDGDSTRNQLQFKDMAILKSRGDPCLDADGSFCRALWEESLPVNLLPEDSHQDWAGQIESVARRARDEVTVANLKDIQGLEWRLVVYLSSAPRGNTVWLDARLKALSRAKDQVVIVVNQTAPSNLSVILGESPDMFASAAVTDEDLLTPMRLPKPEEAPICVRKRVGAVESRDIDEETPPSTCAMYTCTPPLEDEMEINENSIDDDGKRTFRLEFELKPEDIRWTPARADQESRSESPGGSPGWREQDSNPESPREPHQTLGGRQALLARLEKVGLTDGKNLLTSYTAARTTQTDSESMASAPGPELCLGGWQAAAAFSAAGGELRKPRSRVVLKVPEDAVPRGTYRDVRLSVSADVEHVGRVLGLNPRHVASPLAELSAGKGFRFDKLVTIVLPHCLPRNVHTAEVQVYRVTRASDGQVHLQRLRHSSDPPPKPDNNSEPESEPQLGAVFTLADDGTVRVQTPCFSGYVCVYCERRLSGRPRLFFRGAGTNSLMPDGRQQASVQLAVWDERLINDEFAQACMDYPLVTKGMCWHLPAADDYSGHVISTKLETFGKNLGAWHHEKGQNGESVFSPQQEFEVAAVLDCECNEFSKTCLEWKLETEDGRSAGLGLRCVVEIVHQPSNTKPPKFSIEVPSKRFEEGGKSGQRPEDWKKESDEKCVQTYQNEHESVARESMPTSYPLPRSNPQVGATGEGDTFQRHLATTVQALAEHMGGALSCQPGASGSAVTSSFSNSQHDKSNVSMTSSRSKCQPGATSGATASSPTNCQHGASNGAMASSVLNCQRDASNGATVSSFSDYQHEGLNNAIASSVSNCHRMSASGDAFASSVLNCQRDESNAVIASSVFSSQHASPNGAMTSSFANCQQGGLNDAMTSAHSNCQSDASRGALTPVSALPITTRSPHPPQPPVVINHYNLLHVDNRATTNSVKNSDTTFFGQENTNNVRAPGPGSLALPPPGPALDGTGNSRQAFG